MRHRAAMRSRIRNESIAAVIRNVEPLMSISRPRIRRVDTGEQVPVRRAGCDPKAERSIDMYPCSESLRDGNENLKLVEGPNIQIACLQDYNRRRAGIGGECRFERGRLQSAVGVR